MNSLNMFISNEKEREAIYKEVEDLEILAKSILNDKKLSDPEKQAKLKPLNERYYSLTYLLDQDIASEEWRPATGRFLDR